MTAPDSNCWDVLGIDPTSNAKLIKKAHRRQLGLLPKNGRARIEDLPTVHALKRACDEALEWQAIEEPDAKELSVEEPGEEEPGVDVSGVKQAVPETPNAPVAELPSAADDKTATNALAPTPDSTTQAVANSENQPLQPTVISGPVAVTEPFIAEPLVAEPSSTEPLATKLKLPIDTGVNEADPQAIEPSTATQDETTPLIPKADTRADISQFFQGQESPEEPAVELSTQAPGDSHQGQDMTTATQFQPIDTLIPPSAEQAQSRQALIEEQQHRELLDYLQEYKNQDNWLGYARAAELLLKSDADDVLSRLSADDNLYRNVLYLLRNIDSRFPQASRAFIAPNLRSYIAKRVRKLNRSRKPLSKARKLSYAVAASVLLIAGVGAVNHWLLPAHASLDNSANSRLLPAQCEQTSSSSCGNV